MTFPGQFLENQKRVGMLVGLVIEESTGRTYYEEVTRRFLAPLKLRLTRPADRVAATASASSVW